MRIISGTARGRRLATFAGQDIRPTPDRVREAVFSILFSRIGALAGMQILDLFAGTGAMALEALSRGADQALLIDNAPRAAALIRTNIDGCRFQERAAFRQADVARELPRLQGRTFDLIFLDPPYGRDLVPTTLAAVARLGLLAPDGIACAEAADGDAVPERIDGLERIDQRRYGSISVHLFSHSTPAQEPEP